MAAVALMVIEVVTLSSGRPASRSRMSSIESMATPTGPPHPRRAGGRSRAHLGGQVEGAGQPGLALLRAGSCTAHWSTRPCRTGVLAHGPQAAAVHVGWIPRVNGYRPGRTQLLHGIPALEVSRFVDRADLDARIGEPLGFGRAGRAVGCHGTRLRGRSEPGRRGARHGAWPRWCSSTSTTPSSTARPPTGAGRASSRTSGVCRPMPSTDWWNSTATASPPVRTCSPRSGTASPWLTASEH